MYIQIEIYKRLDNYPFTSYKLGSFRTMIIFIIICGFLVILRINISILFSNFNIPMENQDLEKLIFHIIIQFLAVNVIPILMILKNEKIVTYAKTKFMCNNVVHNAPPIWALFDWNKSVFFCSPKYFVWIEQTRSK